MCGFLSKFVNTLLLFGIPRTILFAIYLTMIEFLGLTEAEGGEAMTDVGIAEFFFKAASGASEARGVEPNKLF